MTLVESDHWLAAACVIPMLHSHDLRLCGGHGKRRSIELEARFADEFNVGWQDLKHTATILARARAAIDREIAQLRSWPMSRSRWQKPGADRPNASPSRSFTWWDYLDSRIAHTSPVSVTMYAVWPMISSEVGWFRPVAIGVIVPSLLTRSSAPVSGSAGEPSG